VPPPLDLKNLEAQTGSARSRTDRQEVYLLSQRNLSKAEAFPIEKDTCRGGRKKGKTLEESG